MATINGNLTNAAEALILDYILNGTAFTLPTCYLALWQGDPTDSGAGSSEAETPGTDGYNRIAVGTAGSCKFAAASSRGTASNVDLTWGPATPGAWAQHRYVAMMSASTGGTMYAYWDLGSNYTVGINDSFKITSGNLTFAAGTTSQTKWVDAVVHSILDHLTGRATYTQPTTYLALFEGDPLGAGAETETAGANGYSRQAIAASTNGASGGSLTNDAAAILFGPSTTAWGTVDYFAVYDASTAGTKMGGSALGASKVVGIGDSVNFATSQLTFTLD